MSLHRFPVKFRILYKIYTSVFRCLTSTQTEHQQQLRSSDTKKNRMALGHFSVASPTPWNSLPFAIGTSISEN